MTVPSDQQAWRRTLDDLPIIPHPRARFYPRSVEDVVEIVKTAEAAGQSAPAIRAVGSHWAPCEAAVNREGFIIETNNPDEDDNRDAAHPMPGGRLNRALFNVLGKDGCLTDEALQFFRQQGVSSFDPQDKSDMSADPGRGPNTGPKTGPDNGRDSGTKKFFLAHFEAGTRVYEAYSRLDKGFDDDTESLCALPGFETYRGPWAMITLGGAGGQTLAGVVSTATHGGDIFMPPIADAVQAVHVIGAGGRQFWIDRDLPGGIRLTSNSKLLQKLGNTLEIHHDDQMLDAAMVSVGRFGIIYSVVLRVVRQYALDQVTNPDPTTRAAGEKPIVWTEAKKRLDDIVANFGNERFLQVIINPNGRSGADERDVHSCFITVRRTKPLAAAIPPGQTEPAGRAERTGANLGNNDAYSKSPSLGNLFCRLGGDSDLEHWFDPLVDVINVALTAARGVFLALIVELIPFPLNLLLGAAATSDAALREILDFCTGHDIFKEDAQKLEGLLDAKDIVDDVISNRNHRTIGGMVADICNRLVAIDRVEYVRFLSEMAITAAGRPEEMTAISYAVMDSHSYADKGCKTRGVSLEAFMDAKAGGTDPVPKPVKLVEAIFEALSQLQAGTLPRAGGQRLAFAGAISLRFMKASRGLIAMQQDEITCSLELQGLGACSGNQVFMEEITARATDLGARMHWGQFNETVGIDTIEAQYGDKLDRWRDVLAALTHNGRQTTFSTPFTVKKGLEVVRPKIENYSVIPRFAVAREKGLASWNLRDNPPGTTARLSLTPVGGVTSTSGPLELLTAKQFDFDAGEKDVTLEVSRTFNGRPYSAAQTARIRGFGASNPDWIHEQVATLTEVTGIPQFAVQLVFHRATWSPLLRVETIRVEFGEDEGDVQWHLISPGAIGRQFTAAEAEQNFLIRPHLAGESGAEWFFVHHRLGQPPGSGSPPKLRVRFRLSADPLPTH